MTLARRGFLRGLLGAPFAAKAAVEKVAAEAMNLRPDGLGNYATASPPYGEPLATVASEPMTREQRSTKVTDFLRRFGLPDWEMDSIREQNRGVYTLDPDIASKRSWSLNVKIATQRERNISREINRLQANVSYSAKLEDFRKRHGFWLRW